MSPVIVSPEIDGIIRAAAQAIAGALVTTAHLDPTSGATITGVIIGVVTVAWSWWQKRHERAMQTVAVQAGADAALMGTPAEREMLKWPAPDVTGTQAQEIIANHK